MRQDPGGWSLRLDADTIARYRASGVWRGQTLAQHAWALAERDPARITHVFDRPYRIAELLPQAEALAASFLADGLCAGDVISFQLPNWVEAMLVDLAAAMLGLVVAPIVPIYRDAEVAYMLGDSRTRLAIVPQQYRGHDYTAMMQRLQPQLPALRHVVTVRGEDGNLDRFETRVAAGARLLSRPAVDPDAVKMILYTSGTTGRPKAVLHSHNTAACTVQIAARYWGLAEGDTMLMASPVTHITGFGSGLELPLLCGMRTVFMERWSAAEGLALIEREHATVSIGATPFLQELLDEAERCGARLPSLRIYACGGAAVPPALIDRAHAVLEHCRAFRVFGSSEVPLVTLGFVAPGEARLAADTDGKVVHYEVRIVDDEGRDLPNGREGEILARGPGAMLGYADPQQTADSFDSDGYFRTGDLGYLTPEQAIVVTGRKKDLINRGGEKISAKEIEDILHAHPAIHEAAVVAMPHPRLGETVCAYVILQPGATLDLDRMLAHVAAAGVARQKYPERLLCVDSLPRTASGKIRKDLLRADIAGRIKAGE